MSIPEGYKLVPVEPTNEMYLAFCDARSRRGSTFLDGIRASIAAAPTPPKPIYDEAKERELFDAWFTSVAGFWQSGGLDGRKASMNGWQACAQSRAKAGEDV